MFVKEIIMQRCIFIQAIPGIFLKIHTIIKKCEKTNILERTIFIQLLPGIFLCWKE